MGAKSQIAVATVCVAVAASAAVRDRLRPVVLTHGDMRGGEKVSVVFTEFADPSGMEVYFRVPDMANAAPIPLVDDKLINEYAEIEAEVGMGM